MQIKWHGVCQARLSAEIPIYRILKSEFQAFSNIRLVMNDTKYQYIGRE